MLNEYRDKINGVMMSKILMVSIFALFLSGCTDMGSWDFIKNISGDVLNNLLTRYTFDLPSNPGNDDSGNGYHGTMNGATWVDDPIRRGVLEFDGINDYVAVPVISGGIPEFTISVWICITSLDPLFSSIYSSNTFNPQDIHFHIRTSGLVQVGINGNTPTNINSVYALDTNDLGRWQHIAVVYSASDSDISIYVNGEIDRNATYPFAGNPGFNAGWIGGWTGDPNRWFEGRIDDLRFYGRDLSAAEIRAVYQTAPIHW